MTTLSIDVVGVPAPQGSHRGFVVNGRAVITQDNKKTKPWRQDVTAAALNAIAEAGPGYPLAGGLQVTIEFRLPRIKAHYRTGAHAHQLRPDAPTYSSKKPDIDKLQRSALDALTNAGVWHDDAQVSQITVSKVFAEPGKTGATIHITPMDAAQPTPAASIDVVDEVMF